MKGARLGTLKYERVGGGISGERVVEVWEDGEETRDLKRRKEELRQRRVMMEKRQKEAKKQVKVRVWGDCSRRTVNRFTLTPRLP